MGNNQFAFRRSKSMFAAILAIVSSGGPLLEQYTKLQALGEYRSRGKGGKFKRGKIFNHGTGRYSPHQGAQECARRSLKGEPKTSVPRRLWTVVYEPGYSRVKGFARLRDARHAAQVVACEDYNKLNITLQ